MRVLKIICQWVAIIIAILSLTAFGWHFMRFATRGFSCIEGMYAIICLINTYGMAAVGLLVGR